jgi:hypothetical protein
VALAADANVAPEEALVGIRGYASAMIRAAPIGAVLVALRHYSFEDLHPLAWLVSLDERRGTLLARSLGFRIC